ncbi:hypothetical protein BKN38_01695 [Helicobacter sp. CLO-3]|nr:hypothetical protein BA723_04810 [Helicobacter sp. CLO-3]OHU85266.1 hypothetical protein BKN38_01695 [Helicobacter sp. CLO-3]
MGEGKVLLDTSVKAYEGIYITSGRGTLALVEGKAEALGAVKQSAGGGSGGNSYTLAQDSASTLGFYFGNNGGKLDLGGNSLSLNVISANDAKAVITNSANTASNFSIQGFSYDKSGNKTTTKADYIAHASFEGNLNLIQKNATKGDESIVFDGNIDIQGKLESENANIVLQGHPTTHAVVDDKVLAQVKAAEEKTGYRLPSWMDLSRPSTLQQPDWDKRTFKIAGGIDLKSSNFTLGRSASLESDITADASSKLNFGGKINHFIDKSDGSNTRGSGFSFYQEVSKGVLENEANDTISYKGKITASGAKIESSIHDFNASLDLSAGASLKASYLTLSSSQNSIKLSNASSASVDHLIISGLSVLGGFSIEAGSSFSIKQSFIFDNTSGFSLGALDSAGFSSMPSNYDLIARNKSSINGTSKDLIANVALIGGSSATLKSLTLKDTNAAGQSEAGKLKKEIILSGEGTKLTLNENLASQDLAGALVQVSDKASLNITNDMIFSFSGARPSKNDAPNALDSNQTYIFVSGGASASMRNLNATNMNVNLSVDKDSTFGAQKVIGNNSAFSVALGSAQSFGIELSGGEMSLQAAIDSAAINSTILDSSASAGTQTTQESLQKAYENIALTGDITASQNAKIESNLASLTSSIALSDTASLNLNSGVLNLNSAHNAITLRGTASLSAQRIYAKSLSTLALNVDSSARLNVSELVFDSSSVEVARYFGENLYAQNASALKQTEQNLAQNLYLSGGSSFEGLYKSPLDVSAKTITISGNTDNKDNERYIALTQGSKLIANNLEATNIKRLNIALDSTSRLEIDKLSANNASVYLSFDTVSGATSSTRDFDIDASNNSHIFINSWNLNGVNQGNANNTSGANGAIDSGITSDSGSRVHFGTLQITQREISTQAINGAFSIDGNVAISGLLSLEGLGKIDSAMPFNLGLLDDISATNTATPATTAANASANTTSANSLSAQTTASLNRFLALQVEKTLALESDARISVSIDSSFDKNNIKLNHYYTLAKAQGGIDDARLDKRIDFIFSDAGDKLYTTTIVENGEIKVSFTQDDPKSLAELSKHNERADILEAILTHNPNDDTIDRAARTGDYALLGAYVGAIDSDMASIARINQQAFSEQILLTNNEAINTRILQASINQARAMSALQKRVRLADTSDKALKERLDEVAQAQKELARKNSMWLNVGGGYFKQSAAGSHNAIYGTNIDYDRFFATRGADILLGAMLGVNGANAMAKTHKDTTRIYNAGLYLSIRARQNEIQANLNGLILDTERSFGGTFGEEKIDSATGAMLFSAYYKYAFRLGKGNISADSHALDSGAFGGGALDSGNSLDSSADSVGVGNASDLGGSASHFAHILKPVGQLSFAYNGGGGFRSQNFRQQSINDAYLALGVGGEYVLSSKDASYALQILARATLFHTQDKILVTLSNANNFISYDLRHAPVNFALNFMGQNALTSALSLSYGLSALIDSSANFGLKGDVKLEYKF